MTQGKRVAGATGTDKLPENWPEASAREASWGPPPPSVATALRPWIDLREVGPEEFYRWLASIARFLPPPVTRAGPAKSAEERIAELARALADSSGAEAESHFRASEYFRENTLLARRVKALEAILRTSRQTVPPPSPATDIATERYLPRGGGP